MTTPRIPMTQYVDLLTVEREARALRARVIAESIRSLVAWLRTRLAARPEGRTA